MICWFESMLLTPNICFILYSDFLNKKIKNKIFHMTINNNAILYIIYK